MYQICFYSPISHVEKIKDALFLIGAGKYGNYDCCSWQTIGQGQFRPLNGSAPFIGQQNHLERIEECKVEMICNEEVISKVIEELIALHPYEEPSYQVYKILSQDEYM